MIRVEGETEEEEMHVSDLEEEGRAGPVCTWVRVSNWTANSATILRLVLQGLDSSFFLFLPERPSLPEHFVTPSWTNSVLTYALSQARHGRSRTRPLDTIRSEGRHRKMYRRRGLYCSRDGRRLDVPQGKSTSLRL